MQVTTSTSAKALQRPAADKVAILCDGSLLVADYDGTAGHLYQVTDPYGSPAAASVITVPEDGVSLCVQNAGTTTSDIWVASTTDDALGGGPAMHVRHGVYTASGSSFAWDASTAVTGMLTPGTSQCSVTWTGTWLIVMWWDGIGSSSNDQVRFTWTTDKTAATGWAADAKFDPSGTNTTVWQVCVRHSAKLAATVAVYAGASKDHFAILKDSAADPSRANWTAMADIDAGFDDTEATFGGPQMLIDEAAGLIHVARSVANSGGPTWFGVTYWKGTPDATPMVTPSIAWSSRLIVDSAGSATAPLDPAIAMDTAGRLWLFWVDAASAGNLKYATLASPYTSAPASTTLVSTGTPRYPHTPVSPLATAIPLVYLSGTASPFSVVLDTSISLISPGPPAARGKSG